MESVHFIGGRSQKTVGFCSYLANFSQLFYCRLAKRYTSRTVMRSLLVLLLFLSLKTFACGEEGKEFYPFIVKLEEQRNSQQKLKVFEILSPIKKGEEFLSSVTARLEGEFELNLDIREDFSYVGNYYRSYISVANKHIDEIEIILSYNTTNKDRSNMLFCANWKIYKLTKLLSFEPAKEVPEIPPPPPKPQD